MTNRSRIVSDAPVNYPPPVTHMSLFTGCNSLQCAGIARILTPDQKYRHWKLKLSL